MFWKLSWAFNLPVYHIWVGLFVMALVGVILEFRVALDWDVYLAFLFAHDDKRRILVVSNKQ